MTALGDLLGVPGTAAISVRSLFLLGVIAILVAAIIFRSRIQSLVRGRTTPFQDQMTTVDRPAPPFQAERNRIADELHDTLLQGIHGLIWKFQALSERLPPGDPVRTGMADALQGADRVLVEGRDRVLDLRASDDGRATLLEQLKRAVEEITLDPAVRLTARSQGEELELHSRVHLEVIAIAAEALRHAYRHSSARNIELQIVFEATALRVRIAHDGAVAPNEGQPTVPTAARWGLAGMQERALAMSAQLRVARLAEKHQAIELVVSGPIAFGRNPRRRIAEPISPTSAGANVC